MGLAPFACSGHAFYGGVYAGHAQNPQGEPKAGLSCPGAVSLPGAGFGCPRPGFSARDAPRCLEPPGELDPLFLCSILPGELDPLLLCQAPPCSARCRLQLPQSSPIRRLASFQRSRSGLARTLPPKRWSGGMRTNKGTPHWFTPISGKRTAPGWRKTR